MASMTQKIFTKSIPRHLNLTFATDNPDRRAG